MCDVSLTHRHHWELRAVVMEMPDDVVVGLPTRLAEEVPAGLGERPDSLNDLTLGSLEHAPADRDPLRDRHVLVIGINYAPEPTGIAPYTTGTARHLASRAASVEVLTGLPHYPHWSIDARYRRHRSFAEPRRTPGEPDVRRLWHHVPGRQTAATRALYEATFAANVLVTRPQRRPDVVLTVTPALGGAVAAARIAARSGARLVVIVQDLMAKAAGQCGISGGSTVAGLTAKLEGNVLRRAGQVIVVSDSFRDAVRAYGVDDARIAVLPNWTHITPSEVSRDQARAALGWAPGRFVVAHTGNMGLKQDLGTVIEAARRLPEGIDVLLIGEGNQRRALQEQAAGLPTVRFAGPLDGVTYPLALAAADLLLVNERPSVGDMSLPSKLTSYLSAGRPVLAAVTADGATATELRRTQGAGLVVRPGDPDLLARSIVQLQADEPLRTAMGRAGWTYAHARLDQYSSMLHLDDILNRLLAPAPPPVPAPPLAPARCR
jgi:glycosyltransferase involved in cell wall biosynthesis